MDNYITLKDGTRVYGQKTTPRTVRKNDIWLDVTEEEFSGYTLSDLEKLCDEARNRGNKVE